MIEFFTYYCSCKFFLYLIWSMMKPDVVLHAMIS